MQIPNLHQYYNHSHSFLQKKYLQYRRAYAAHAGDHAIYPDCRPEFVEALRQASLLCDYNSVDLWTPFLDKTKADICRIGQSLKVPYEETWSCYKGKDIHCGTCGTCHERRSAFIEAGILDPTVYQATQ